MVIPGHFLVIPVQKKNLLIIAVKLLIIAVKRKKNIYVNSCPFMVIPVQKKPGGQPLPKS